MTGPPGATVTLSKPTASVNPSSVALNKVDDGAETGEVRPDAGAGETDEPQAASDAATTARSTARPSSRRSAVWRTEGAELALPRGLERIDERLHVCPIGSRRGG